MKEQTGSPRVASGEAREEVGNSSTSALHPPHPSVNATDAQIQEETESRGDIPVMPANASGTDRVPAEDQAQPIDPASMYDRRPAEDKNRPPSGR